MSTCNDVWPFYNFQGWYFDRDDVALPGFAKYFKKASEEEREHAEKFMKYQNQRGGRIVLQNIQVCGLCFAECIFIADCNLR